jgi:hypothetical protein
VSPLLPLSLREGHNTTRPRPSRAPAHGPHLHAVAGDLALLGHLAPAQVHHVQPAPNLHLHRGTRTHSQGHSGPDIISTIISIQAQTALAFRPTSGSRARCRRLMMKTEWARDERSFIRVAARRFCWSPLARSSAQAHRRPGLSECETLRHRFSPLSHTPPPPPTHPRTQRLQPPGPIASPTPTALETPFPVGP